MKQFCIATVCICVVSALTLCARVSGQEKKSPPTPNFTGTWKVNLEKSNYGPAPAPQSMVYKIEHKEPSLKITSTRVDDGVTDTVVLNLTTDGKEGSNVVRGNEVKSKVKWEGVVLWIDSVTTIDGNTFALKDKWNLSEDGKTLNWARHFSGPDGEAEASYVLEIQ